LNVVVNVSEMLNEKRTRVMNISDVNKNVRDEFGIDINIEDWISTNEGVFEILLGDKNEVIDVLYCKDLDIEEEGIEFENDMFEYVEDDNNSGVYVRINSNFEVKE